MCICGNILVPVICGTTYGGRTSRDKRNNMYIAATLLLWVYTILGAFSIIQLQTTVEKIIHISRLLLWIFVDIQMAYVLATQKREGDDTTLLWLTAWNLTNAPAIVILLVPATAMIGIEPWYTTTNITVDIDTISANYKILFRTYGYLAVVAKAMLTAVSATPAAYNQINTKMHIQMATVMMLSAVVSRLMTAFIISQLWFYFVNEAGPFIAIVWMVGGMTDFITNTKMRCAISWFYRLTMIAMCFHAVIIISSLDIPNWVIDDVLGLMIGVAPEFVTVYAYTELLTRMMIISLATSFDGAEEETTVKGAMAEKDNTMAPIPTEEPGAPLLGENDGLIEITDIDSSTPPISFVPPRAF